MEPRFDIVLPTHNHQRLTMGCLEQLYAHTYTPFHLIIVDDSTDLTPIYLGQIQKDNDNVTVFHSDEPFKCGNQVFNIGLGYCKTPYMATVMNSIEVEPQWERVALALMGNDPKIATVGFKCLFATKQGFGLIECAGIWINQFLPCDMGREEPGHRLCEVYQVEAIQWAFALHRVEALKGNLSEDVFHGWVGVDDIDNCFVLRSKGWKIFYSGTGVGYHHTRATRGVPFDDVAAYDRNRENLEAFYKRWGYWDIFHKSNPEVPETLKDVKMIADGKKMLEAEIAIAGVG